MVSEDREAVMRGTTQPLGEGGAGLVECVKSQSSAPPTYKTWPPPHNAFWQMCRSRSCGLGSTFGKTETMAIKNKRQKSPPFGLVTLWGATICDDTNELLNSGHCFDTNG